MARRQVPATHGNRYIGNVKTTEMHDLDNEETGASQRQIDEIMRAGHAGIFHLGTLSQAHNEGYDNCADCIGGSNR